MRVSRLGLAVGVGPAGAPGTARFFSRGGGAGVMVFGFSWAGWGLYGGGMVTIDVEYKGDLRCVAKHGPSGVEVTTDAPVDNHGKGESFSPTDLCATALAACMATIMGIQARTLGIDLKGMRIQVKKGMTATAPRRIAQLPVEFWVPCKLDEKQKAQLVRAAESCPVHHSLHPEIEKPIIWHWAD